MADASTTDAAAEETPAPPAEETPKTDDKSMLAEEAGKDTPSLLGEGDEKKPAEEAKSEEDAPKTEVPEQYEDFKLPDGVELNSELIEEFKPLAKELGLSQEQAQKLVDLQAKANASQLAAQEQAYNEQVAGWRKEISEHPESKEMLANARKALDAFATDAEIRHFLTDTWLGNHPLVIKFLAKIGQSAGEDHFGGSPSKPKAARDARAIYHTMPNA